MESIAGPPLRRWSFFARVICTFVLSFAGVGALLRYYLEQPAWELVVVAAVYLAVPPTIVIGSLAVFQHTRALGVWLFRVFILSLGWFGGLMAATPVSYGDKVLLMDTLFMAIVPFAAVALLLVVTPLTRRVGKQMLVSFVLLPVSGLLGWYTTRWAVPEWHDAMNTHEGRGHSFGRTPDNRQCSADELGAG